MRERRRRDATGGAIGPRPMTASAASIPLLDLPTQYAPLAGAHARAIRRVLESAQFILGPEVAAFEDEIAAHLGVEHAVGVASGTDALVLALRALDIGPGDEVIVPSYTFFATAEAVLNVGATPVLVDIDAATYNVNVDAVEAAISPRTRAVIPVHLFGLPADMTALGRVLAGREIKVIEDNAQAMGATHRGRYTGTFGDAAALSFFPSKNLGAFGDGGMVITHDTATADRLRMLRTHGWRKKYHPEIVAYNSRLDALQAAVLRINLQHVEGWNDARRAAAGRYREYLADLPVSLPVEPDGDRHVYHLYVIRTPHRDEVAAYLSSADIGCGVYYPVPLHRVGPCLPYAPPPETLPAAEAASAETLAIPLFPTISGTQQARVASVLRDALASVGAI
jgi:dTDP-4-amino-4,6-dideoxygalactose transaminase